MVHRPRAKEVTFDDLTMAEFVAGTCNILQLPELPSTERNSRLEHMHYLMNLTAHYKWAHVRSLYAAALEDIQCGVRAWEDSLVPLKEAYLFDSARIQTSTTNRLLLCRKFNYDVCKYTNCKFQHMCIACWKNNGTL